MTKTIKSAEALSGAFKELEAALTAGNATLPEPTAAALGRLRKSVNTAATALLEAGQNEVQRAIENTKAKLKL